jgi:hypothetical protein
MKTRYFKAGFSPTSLNTLKLVIRIIFIAAGLSVTVGILTSSVFNVIIDPAWFISISALVGTAIGLGSAQALGNIIAGFYILASRPFKIEDYVQIGEEEGIIKEINLTYSRIKLLDGTIQLIPNSKVITSEIKNFKIRQSKLLELLGEEPGNKEKALVDHIKSLVKEEETWFRYAFNIQFKIDTSLSTIRKVSAKVANKWASKFQIPPRFSYNESDAFRHYFTFVLIVKNPYLILDNKSKFSEDIMEELEKSKTIQ